MVTETQVDPTQVAPPEPAPEPSVAPTPEVAPDAAAVTPPADGDPSGAAIGGEGAEPEAAPATPSWHSVTERDDLINVPEIADYVTELVDFRLTEARKQDVVDFQKWQEQLKGDAVMRQLGSHIGSIKEMLESGDYVGADAVLDRLERDFVSKFEPAYLQTERDIADDTARRSIAALAMEEAKKILPERGQLAINRHLKSGAADWPTILGTIKSELVKPLEDKIKAQDVEIERLTAAQRGTQEVNLAPSGSSGSQDYREELRGLIARNAPINEIAEVRARMKAGGG